METGGIEVVVGGAIALHGAGAGAVATADAAKTLTLLYQLNITAKDGSELKSEPDNSTVSPVKTKPYNEATFKAFEKQLKEHGLKSIQRTQVSIQKKLIEHIHKLDEIKKAGGFTSSVEREIRTFQNQLEAIKDLLKK